MGREQAADEKLSPDTEGKNEFAAAHQDCSISESCVSQGILSIFNALSTLGYIKNSAFILPVLL